MFISPPCIKAHNVLNIAISQIIRQLSKCKWQQDNDKMRDSDEGLLKDCLIDHPALIKLCCICFTQRSSPFPCKQIKPPSTFSPIAFSVSSFFPPPSVHSFLFLSSTIYKSSPLPKVPSSFLITSCLPLSSTATIHSLPSFHITGNAFSFKRCEDSLHITIHRRLNVLEENSLFLLFLSDKLSLLHDKPHVFKL